MRSAPLSRLRSSPCARSAAMPMMTYATAPDGASVVNNTSVISLSAVAKPVIAKAYR